LVPIEVNILLLANAHSICGVVVSPASRGLLLLHPKTR
jgi:hypothetical protein